MSTTKVVLSPTSTSVGSTVTVTVSGSGFDPSSAITIEYDKVALATNPALLTTDRSGSLPSTATFTVPSFSTLGSHTVSVTDASRKSFSANLTIISPPNGKKINQILSIAIFVALVVIGVLFTKEWQHAFIVALSGGALGGLAHEIVQSGGKFILPGTDESNNFCLGGLVGIIEGAVAGLLAYQGLLGTKAGVVVTMQLVVASIAGGFALKGIADAPNPT
jgi:hypothetical protein